MVLRFVLSPLCPDNSVSISNPDTVVRTSPLKGRIFTEPAALLQMVRVSSVDVFNSLIVKN